jgi:hypothetical protein
VVKSGTSQNDEVRMIKFYEEAVKIIDRQTFQEASRLCKSFEKSTRPKSHGFYSAALIKSAMGEVMKPFEPTCVLFFSDGKPSDTAPRGKGDSNEKKKNLLVTKVLSVCNEMVKSKQTFKFHTIGFGKDEDFTILEAMALSLPNNMGQFHNSGLELGDLTKTITSFSTSVTESRLLTKMQVLVQGYYDLL